MATSAAGDPRTLREELPPALPAALLDALPVGVACIDADLRVVYANGAGATTLGVAAGTDLGSGSARLAPLAAAARAVMAGGAAVDLLLGADGPDVRVLGLDERHAGVVVGSADPRASGRADDDAALRQVATLVAAGAGEPAVFEAVCLQTARLFRVEATSVLRFISEHRAVVVGVWRKGGSHGLPVNAELDFDARNSTLGRVAATGRPARVDRYAGAPGDLPRLMEAIEIRASVATPIVVQDRVWGALVAATTRDEPVAAGTEERLEPFAQLVGQALENAESRRRLAESADESRRRLERGLHAGARQHLLALKLKLRLARDRAGAGADVIGLLDDALDEAAAADASLRELAHEVHPAVLTERGLAAALQSLAAKAGTRVLLRALPGRRFAPAVETTAYQVVAEGLSNVAAHAHATKATVSVADQGDRLVVEVADDGIGGADPSGSGLRALADRVAAVGGHLAIASPPGDRTVIRAELPLTR
jgi:signal transduction histidine kinase